MWRDHMETRNLTCINCPMGCQLSVVTDGGEVLSVAGNTCPRGEIYAKKEVTHPTRIVTSTVRVSGGVIPVVSVKTASDIPKESIGDVMDAVSRVCVSAPVHIGDVLLADAAGTGVPLVATKNVAARLS